VRTIWTPFGRQGWFGLHADSTLLPIHTASSGTELAPTRAVESAYLGPFTSSRQAILGSAYNSKKQEFAGQSCIAGNSVPTGTATGTFSFDQSLSESQASQQLGFGAGGRARFGAVEASASAQFMRNAASSAYSLSSVWVSEYKLPTQKLNAPKPNEIGRALAQNDDRWVETCGDEYVGEITYGARLFFSIRVDFSSTEEKQSFQAQFALSGPLFSANANLQQASQQFSKNAKVTVSALQFGGDVSKVTGLFADGDAGRAGFVQCTLGSFSSCADVISAALKYATSTTTGFPSQIAPGANGRSSFCRVHKKGPRPAN